MNDTFRAALLFVGLVLGMAVLVPVAGFIMFWVGETLYKWL
jgi:hypothetical protein